MTDPTDTVREIDQLRENVRVAQHAVLAVPEGESAVSEIRAFHRALDALRNIALGQVEYIKVYKESAKQSYADALALLDKKEQENARLKAEVATLRRLYEEAEDATD